MNSYVSFARFLFSALHLPVPPHMSQGTAPVPAHSTHLFSALPTQKGELEKTAWALWSRAMPDNKFYLLQRHI